MEFENLKDPFNDKGEPSPYLRLLLPYFDSERVTKYEMLKRFGVDIKTNPSKRNTQSKVLAELSKHGILKVQARGSGYWQRGDNWKEFMMWLISKMLSNETTKGKFTDLLISYDSNTMDFIMKS